MILETALQTNAHIYCYSLLFSDLDNELRCRRTAEDFQELIMYFA